MKVEQVPQDANYTLGGHRKLVYARDAEGRMVQVETTGWEAEEIVTDQAIHRLQALAEEARARVAAGHSAPLEYWMYAQRMDIELLSQTTGLWQWRIRRHLRPAVFARLSPKLLARYAEALGLTVETVCQLPMKD